MENAHTRIADDYNALRSAITHAIVLRVDALQAELRRLPPTANALEIVDVDGIVVVEVAPPTDEAWNRCVDKVQTFRDVDSALDTLFDARTAVDKAHRTFTRAVHAQNDVLAKMEAEILSTPTNVGYMVRSRRLGSVDAETLKRDAILNAYADELKGCAVREATCALEYVLKEHNDTKDGGLQGTNVAFDPWSMETSAIRCSIVSLQAAILPLRSQLQDVSEWIRESAKTSMVSERHATAIRLAHAHASLTRQFEDAPLGSEEEQTYARKLLLVEQTAWPLIELGTLDEEDPWDTFFASRTDVLIAEATNVSTLNDWKSCEDDAKTLLGRIGFRYYLLQTMIDLHRHLLVAKSIEYLKPTQPHSADIILSALLDLANIEWPQTCRPAHVAHDCVRHVLLWFANSYQDHVYANHETRCRTSFVELDCDTILNEEVETRRVLPSLYDAAQALRGIIHLKMLTLNRR